MRLLCRIGWHKWGKWSSMWYQNVTNDWHGECMEKRRSLQCQCCGWRDYEVISWCRRDERMMPREPIWEE